MLLQLNLLDAAEMLCTDLRLPSSDVEYILSRLNNEGIKFATVTLPKLSKAILASLEKGMFVRPTDFRWKGSSLFFMNSSLQLIFDKKGRVRQDADPDAIALIRQVCDYFYKLAFDFSEERIKKAMDMFVETDESVLGIPEVQKIKGFVDDMRRNFETFYPKTSSLSVDDILSFRPREGPGSFAKHSALTPTRFYIEKGLNENKTSTQYKAYSGYFTSYPSQNKIKRDIGPDGLNRMVTKTRMSFVRDEERTSEVLFVPKDSRGPRVIAREPQFNLKAQMSYFDAVSSSLEQDTRHRINFKDQGVNQQLVVQSSVLISQYATLDLKEGSDRISYALVKELFRYCPGLTKTILLTRSTHSVLPDKRVIPLKKLAGMGSGLTFPTMALVIHLAVSTFIQQKTGLPYETVSKSVYVYGDDIIVPSWYYAEAQQALELVGLSVNKDKSFRLSHFRESCGVDCFKGVNVTPVRLKLSNANLGKPSMSIELQDAGILQLERHCRELVKAGLWQLSNFYYTRLESVLGPLPNVTGESHVLGRWVFNPEIVLVEDKRRKSWVSKSITVNLGTVNTSRALRKAFRARRTRDEELLLKIQPRVPLDVVDVPREVVLRKRLVFDTAYLGL